MRISAAEELQAAVLRVGCAIVVLHSVRSQCTPPQRLRVSRTSEGREKGERVLFFVVCKHNLVYCYFSHDVKGKKAVPKKKSRMNVKCFVRPQYSWCHQLYTHTHAKVCMCKIVPCLICMLQPVSAGVPTPALGHKKRDPAEKRLLARTATYIHRYRTHFLFHTAAHKTRCRPIHAVGRTKGSVVCVSYNVCEFAVVPCARRGGGMQPATRAPRNA